MTSQESSTTISTPSDREVVVTHFLEAPRELAFDLWTDPKHPPKWMIGPDWTMTSCEIDLRPDGEWLFAWERPDGSEGASRGVYHEVVRPERVVATESWSGDWPETLNTLEFSESEGGTTVTSTIRYPSQEARDAALACSEEVVRSSLQQLEAHLQTL